MKPHLQRQLSNKTVNSSIKLDESGFQNLNQFRQSWFKFSFQIRFFEMASLTILSNYFVPIETVYQEKNILSILDNSENKIVVFFS